MAVKITKHGDKYSAVLNVPNDESKIVWVSPEPMDEESLVRELHKHGAHLTDVYDAILDSDPERKQAFHERNRQELIEEVGPARAAQIEKTREEQFQRQLELSRIFPLPWPTFEDRTLWPRFREACAGFISNRYSAEEWAKIEEELQLLVANWQAESSKE